MNERTCTLDGCDAPHYARGICKRHYVAQRRATGKPKRHELTCEACGSKFTHEDGRRRMCSRECRDILNLISEQTLAAGRAGVIARLAKPRVAPSPPAISCDVRYGVCPACGTLWCSKASGTRIYCSTGCKEQARAKTTCKVIFGTCPECNALWSAPANSGKVYCSTPCRTKANRRNEPRRPRHHRRHALTVHERDNWTCWLCELPTSRKWTATDPLAPTLDHLIPVSLGGSNDPDNLGTAHAICNTRRGARMITTLTLTA